MQSTEQDVFVSNLQNSCILQSWLAIFLLQSSKMSLAVFFSLIQKLGTEVDRSQLPVVGSTS